MMIIENLILATMSEKYIFLDKMAVKVTKAIKELTCLMKDFCNTYTLTYKTAAGKEGPLIMYKQYRLWDRG